MDDHLFNKILENAYTLGQLRHRVRLLKEYLYHQIFAATQPQPQFEPVDSSWLNSLDKTFLAMFNKDNVDKTFENTEATLDTLKPLIIYIAFPPTEELIAQIGFFLRNNLKNHKLFEIRVDPNLVAGCALSFKGIYKDYSLRMLIQSKRAEILASFKKYIK